MTVACTLHNVDMEERFSKKKLDEFGNPKQYFAHNLTNGDFCFGEGLGKATRNGRADKTTGAVIPVKQEVKKFEVSDANELDQRIPKNLMLSMDGKPFVLKAGLEWKANQLFGLGKWSLKTEIVEYDRKEPYALVKATVLYQDQVFENFGEASLENVSNKMMHKYMLHMAVTRAEARALRVATACGFTAFEELEQAKVEAQKLEQVEQIEGEDMEIISEKLINEDAEYANHLASIS